MKISAATSALAKPADLDAAAFLTLMTTGEGGGKTALTILPLAGALKLWLPLVFFTLISGAVVEVPQSGHDSLYSTRRRPHFRQNGIWSL
jgi:hypothetical protein